MYPLKKLALAAAITTLLVACNSSNNTTQTETGNNPTPPVTAPQTQSACQQDIDKGKDLGITSLPDTAASQYKNNFCKYTQLLAPNGKPVAFYAQEKITNEQLIRARSILESYLSDVPGSEYGINKTVVFNQMADNQATLVLLNGSDDGEPPADGQTLYETENVVEGTTAYFDNDPRDAAFEEILHLMHDTGIGIDGTNTQAGVLPEFQKEIRSAMENAIPPGIITSNAQPLGLWANDSQATEWLRELASENSLTQEYLAAIIDTYYGLAGESTAGGSNFLYQPQTRAQIQSMDPMGWALVGGDSPRKFFSEYVTYEARIDGNFQGTFSLSFDAEQRYTHKSQYLLKARLTGSNLNNLVGNAQANTLTGNTADNQLTGRAGDDVIDGGAGTDTAIFSGASIEYTIVTQESVVTVTDKTADRDGVDTLSNIELLQFSDTSFTP